MAWAVDNPGNLIRLGGASPALSPAMGPSVTSPLAALLMGSGVNAAQPAQPYAPGLGAAFAQREARRGRARGRCRLEQQARMAVTLGCYHDYKRAPAALQALLNR